MSEKSFLEKKLQREIKARKQAEQILEKKALELFVVNEKLKQINYNLEDQIEKKTRAFLFKEKQYRKLVETASDIIYNIDLKGHFTYANPTGLNTLGSTKGDLIGKYFLDYIRADYRDKAMSFYLNIVENKIEESYFEFPLAVNNSEEFWLGQNATLIYGEQGPSHFAVIARDITKQKQFEFETIRFKKELKTSEIKYRSIIENMELGLIEVDRDGIIKKANQIFCDLIGFQENELLGNRPSLYMESSQIDPFSNGTSIPYKIQDSAPVFEALINTKEGAQIWNMISGSPFFNIEGDIIGYIGIHYDISPIKKLQEELIKSKEISESAQMAQKQFLATMSHEIRTPLNAIIGMSHLLYDTTLDIEQKELLTIILNSTDLLKSLITDILDLSKIESGHLEVKERPIDIPKIMESLHGVFNNNLLEKGIDFKVVSDPKIDQQLKGDELLLSQVLMNLLSNASKFTHQGSIELNAKIKKEDINSIWIEFSVEDTGIGINNAHLNKIFDQFKQASRTIQEKYGGTGLGLSITKKLIELMGGTIHVSSIEGKGTKFWFDLAFIKTDSPLVGRNELRLNKSNPLSFQNPILIVEDNALNQKYLTKLLEKWHIQYEVANDGKEGYEKALKNKYSIILMDLQMPNMDGFEATEKLRNSNISYLKSIPIIALSASTLLTMKDQVLLVGMNEYLAKPFTPDQLLDVIKKYQEDTNHEENMMILDNNKFRYSENLDHNYLDLFYGDDINYAYEMFAIFTASIPEELMKLEGFIKSKNHEMIYKTAHKIKPTFAMVGLTEFQDLFQELENVSKNENIPYFPFLSKIEDVQQKLALIETEKTKMQQFLKQTNHYD